MEIVVGVTQESQSRDALRLGEALAATLKADLVVAHVYPLQFDFAGPGRVDAEWRAYLLEESQETLDWAKSHLARPDDAVFVKHPNRSSGNGLIDIVEERGAGIIVVGSAPGSSEGRINGGSTADQLFHGSPVPVAIAPHGFRNWAPDTLKRAVIAYRDTPESRHCLEVVTTGLKLRNLQAEVAVELITIIQKVTRMARSRIGPHAEDQVMMVLNEESQAALAAGRQFAAEQGIVADSEVLEGDNIIQALAKFNWEDDDLLVMGSTGAGPLRRVFLGDMTYKLLRAATVPAIVIPRGAEVPAPTPA